MSPQVTTIVVAISRRQIVAIDGCRVSYAIPGAIVIAGRIAVPGPKEDTDNPAISQVLDVLVGSIIEIVLGLVVLPVMGSVIHALVQGVTDRYLPEHAAFAGSGGDSQRKLVETVEVGIGGVGGVPPAVRVAPALVEGGVAVGDVVEHQVEVGPGLQVKVGGLLGRPGHVKGAALVAAQIAIGRSPGGDMPGQQGIRSVLVAQGYERFSKARNGVGLAGNDIAIAAGSDGSGDVVGVGVALLEKAPQVRLDMDNRGFAKSLDFVQEELEVGVVSLHGRGVVEVGVILVVRSGLDKLVIGEDRCIAVRGAIGHIIGSELSGGRVPGSPAATGIDPGREILVTGIPGNTATRHPVEIAR